MSKSWKILIAERNRHVRDLLRREFSAEGYQVQVARDAPELLAILGSDAPPDLLILDLEIPYLSELAVLNRLGEFEPRLPIVIHSFLPAGIHTRVLPEVSAILEKLENTDRLKAVVAEVMARHHLPERPVRP